MSILAQLAGALGRRDDGPNKELAARLAQSADKNSILELADSLTNKDSTIKSDAIKVLYELGALQPDLIAPYTARFVHVLAGKDTRLVWGAMSALHTISKAYPESIYPHLAQILDAEDKGSVISRDHAVGILTQMALHGKYTPEALPLLLDILKDCPVNQLPSYAESAELAMLPAFREEFKVELISILRMRVPELAGLPAKLKRVEKVLRKLG
jgi:hypothetical protein